MSIAPITPIFSATAAAPVSPTASIAKGTDATGVDFAKYIEQVQGIEQNANDTAVKLATGEISDVHQFTVAAAKAQLAVELTAAVRNRAVDAFNEIMRMQV